MAKRVKKKPGSGQKDRRASASLQKAPAGQNFPSKIETDEDGVVGKERKLCPHFDKGVDLATFTSKVSSAEIIRCEDCRVCVTERRGKKGKGNQRKKKGGSSVDSKSEAKAIWVCLECGCFFCGGIGFPTIPQSHAVRHAKQTRHQLAIQYDNLRLRWCFPCNMLIPVEKNGESGDSNDPLSDVVNVIKERSTEKVSVGVKDVWIGSGSILSDVKSENAPFRLNGISGYIVRGLVNLGNTCFFNSIMQNLLAMDRLRDHYLELNESVGPLSVSLKKIFIETISESGFRNVINPRSLFGCVCAKAPQFKGYQQHDSHELLSCLLDGLCTEELSAKKQISRENGTSADKEPTFVDAIFGGQLCSTIACLDCGHSSKMFEPFLDLSVPVPTNRPPSKKAKQPISRAKRQKPPPKRNGRYCPKVSKDGGPLASPSVPDSSVDGVEPVAIQPGDAVEESIGQSLLSETKAMDSPSQIHVEESEKRPLLENVADDLSWLDYLEPDFVANDNGMTSDCNDIAASRDAREKDDWQMNKPMQDDIESSSQVSDGTVTTTGLSKNLAWLDFVEPSAMVDDHDIVSKVDDSVHENIKGDINPFVSGTHSICAESNCSPGNPCENEQPLQVQDSEVILLPYKEESCSNGEVLPGEGEVSSSAIDCELDSLGFDGFGDLFNEPEVVEDPSVKTISNDKADAGSAVENTSESDPDEVDNSNTQVSVESCLAYFTKVELLSISEHGWNCENCSKALQEQKRQSRKKHQKAADEIKQNGAEDRVNGNPSNSSSDSSCPSEVLITSNGDSTKVVVYDNDAKNEKINSILEASNFHESSVGLTQVSSEANVSGIFNGACSANNSTIAICGAEEVRQNESRISAEGSESEGSSDEEMNSESVKVKRDATKRILINKAPSILTIHLKRFSQDGRGRLSKLNGHVDFKDTIDLGPYMDSRCNEIGEHKYHLSGVVEHSGTMRGGHYIAYIRGSRKSLIGDNSAWYYASDTHVRQVSLQEVLNCEAYILFYEKI